MTLYSVIATVIVVIGMVVMILLFERKRARGIERDLREQARKDRGDPGH